MCGIACVFGQFESVTEQQAVIEQMTSLLQHRGPDAWGLYLAPEIAFGHTRLSIVDLAEGHQPMATERHVITFNGEIYNHPELRQELLAEGAAFRTRSDTEVILRLFERDGIEAFAKLNGQFALLIWDRVEHTLTAARDRFGMRPLYILDWRGKTYFSSEMKCFDGIDGFERTFSPQLLLEHAVLWNTLHDDTVYENIRCLEAGTCAVMRRGEPARKHRYHEIGDTAVPRRAIDFESAKEELHALLQNAVDLRLRADVPVGAYLSGGIDSTVIAYLTKKRKADDFETFSVSFEDTDFDESSFQSEVSKAIQSRHVEVKVGRKDIAEHFLETIYHTERPIFRTAAVPLFLLSERVRQSEIRVVLTGEGADEYLYGYDTFKELSLLRRWKDDPASGEAAQSIKLLYPHLHHYSDPKHFGLLRMYYEGFLGDFENELGGLNIRATNNQVIARYLNKDWKVSTEKEAFRARVKEQLPPQFYDWTLLQKTSYLEIRTLLQGYLLSSQGDRMALGHGVEGRYPFLDHRVVDTVFHYPDEYKLRGFSQKHLLRETFRGKVPTSVLDRPKRPYMAPDLVSFFDGGQLRPIAREFLNSAAIKNYGLFDPKLVGRFISKFEQRMPDDIGYRDNMIIIFILSAQMAHYWARHPKTSKLDEAKRTVRILDYPQRQP